MQHAVLTAGFCKFMMTRVGQQAQVVVITLPLVSMIKPAEADGRPHPPLMRGRQKLCAIVAGYQTVLGVIDIVRSQPN